MSAMPHRSKKAMMIRCLPPHFIDRNAVFGRQHDRFGGDVGFDPFPTSPPNDMGRKPVLATKNPRITIAV